MPKILISAKASRPDRTSEKVRLRPTNRSSGMTAVLAIDAVQDHCSQPRIGWKGSFPICPAVVPLRSKRPLRHIVPSLTARRCPLIVRGQQRLSDVVDTEGT